MEDMLATTMEPGRLRRVCYSSIASRGNALVSFCVYTDEDGIDTYLREIDLGKKFKVASRDEAPVKFLLQPDGVPEINGGVLWGYGDSLLELMGMSEEANKVGMKQIQEKAVQTGQHQLTDDRISLAGTSPRIIQCGNTTSKAPYGRPKLRLRVSKRPGWLWTSMSRHSGRGITWLMVL